MIQLDRVPFHWHRSETKGVSFTIDPTWRSVAYQVMRSPAGRIRRIG